MYFKTLQILILTERLIDRYVDHIAWDPMCMPTARNTIAICICLYHVPDYKISTRIIKGYVHEAHVQGQLMCKFLYQYNVPLSKLNIPQNKVEIYTSLLCFMDIVSTGLFLFYFIVVQCAYCIVCLSLRKEILRCMMLYVGATMKYVHCYYKKELMLSGRIK